MFSLTEKTNAIEQMMVDFDTDFRITLDDAELISAEFLTPTGWAFNVYNLLSQAKFDIEQYRLAAKRKEKSEKLQKILAERW